jgi:predicted PurR-regulated permease PerM
VLLGFGIIAGAWLFVQLQGVVIQVLLAVILAAGMTPIVDRLSQPQRLGFGNRTWTPPRAMVVLLLYLTLVLVITLVAAIAIPPAADDVEELVRRLPDYASRFQLWIEGLPERYAFLPAINLSEGLIEQLRVGAAQFASVLGQALVVVRVALGVLTGALSSIFVLVLALYITGDATRLQRYFISWLPADRQAQAWGVSSHIGDRLGGWLRGQILLSGIIGSLTLVGLLAIGVPYPVLLAIIAALGEAVPMVGPIISAVPAVIVAFFQSPLQGLLTVGLYVLIQQLENNLVVPKVMERAVALHPLAVMLALLAGGQLLGVAGAILSVPVAAAVAVVIEEVRRERMHGGQPATPATADGKPQFRAPTPASPAALDPVPGAPADPDAASPAR